MNDHEKFELLENAIDNYLYDHKIDNTDDDRYWIIMNYISEIYTDYVMLKNKISELETELIKRS